MSETPILGRPPLRERVAEEVRVQLARKRISATALAKRLGVSQTYVWRRLTGETAFDMDDLDRISDVLGVALHDLLPAPEGVRRLYAEPPNGPNTSRRKTSSQARPSPERPMAGRPPRPRIHKLPVAA